jgi:hypothetical protein
MVSAMSPHDGALLRDCLLLLNQKNRLSKYFFFFSITIGLAGGIRRIAMLIVVARGTDSAIAHP